jgi:hypothetical protein
MKRITHRGLRYWVFLDSNGDALPITPRAWRSAIWRRN